MTYPRQVKLFIPWSKAMVDGATVDKPDYGKKMRQSKKSARPLARRRKRRKRKKRMKDG